MISQRNDYRIDHSRHMAMYQSELQAIAAIGVEKYDLALECGGDMFGYYDRFGNIIVALVTGPGNSATFQPAHYAQDPEFLNRVNRLMTKIHGTEYVGSFHSHLDKFSSTPSGGDDGAILSICKKNDLSWWPIIILTYAYNDKIEKSLSTLEVKINPFMYTNPQNNAKKIRIPLRVLDGPSPVRKALMDSNDPELTALTKWNPHFPLNRIIYDKYEPQTIKTETAVASFPDHISQHIGKLPIKCQKNITLSVEEDMIAVTFGIYAEKRVTVFYETKKPYKIFDVTLDKNGNSDSIFDSFRRCPGNLKQIYNFLRRSKGRLTKASRKCRTQNKRKVR